MIRDYVRTARRGEGRVQFAVVGRTTLKSDMHALGLDREEKFISVSTEKNSEDLKNYITDRLKQLSVVQEMRNRRPDGPELAQKSARAMRRKILKGADGVFLWASVLLLHTSMQANDDRTRPVCYLINLRLKMRHRSIGFWHRHRKTSLT